MRFLIALTVLALTAKPLAVVAQPTVGEAGSTCRAFSVAIEDDLKAVALLEAEATQESSAPRAQVLTENIVAHQLRAQTNVTLMALNRCAPFPYPIDSHVYEAAAAKCLGSRSQAARSVLSTKTHAEASADCYLPDWNRGG